MAQRSTRKRTASRKPARRASSRSSKRAGARKPDAIRLLKDDHARVDALFERFERTRGDKQKQKIAETICSELKVHAQLEEELFYPAARAAIAEQDLLNEAEVEHASAKDLIAQIERSSPSDARYDALVTVLGEYVRHHVKEEEGELFKKLRQSDLDLVELGERMQARKRSLLGGPATRAIGRLATMLGAPATA
jgi:hemerythrin superfamily protein